MASMTLFLLAVMACQSLQQGAECLSPMKACLADHFTRDDAVLVCSRRLERKEKMRESVQSLIPETSPVLVPEPSPLAGDEMDARIDERLKERE